MISAEELKGFEDLIRQERSDLGISNRELVQSAFNENRDELTSLINQEKISQCIKNLREHSFRLTLNYEELLIESVLSKMSKVCYSPEKLLNKLLDEHNFKDTSLNTYSKVKKIVNFYSIYTSPLTYKLHLSNTNSRRANAGKVFEQIIYQLYEYFGYKYDSQASLGSRAFREAGIGKSVDSVLPSLESYVSRRDRVIVGTMKTTLRERWQQVEEERARLNLPSIYLLTADEDISANKAETIDQHNINLVVYEEVKESISYNGPLSFEDYFLREVPLMFDFWSSCN